MLKRARDEGAGALRSRGARWLQLLAPTREKGDAAEVPILRAGVIWREWLLPADIICGFGGIPCFKIAR